ncbi:MAG TPA: MerR family transcriptional regulator [Terriglobia bacterium]|nr:MerR family transcriptional regulator [Terriglobia bacterium]
MHDAVKPMTIGQVAKLAGVGVETIRFYEREGLLNKPKRKQSGYRMFGPDVVNRIRFIKSVKELGFSLKEIRELLFLRVDSRGTAAEVKRRIDLKIDQIDQRINDLKKVRAALAQVSRTAGKGRSSECPLLDVLEKNRP